MWPGFGSALKAGFAGLSRTKRGAMYGAGAGAVYGAFSDDTSVLGGALMGAGVGAGVARYGGAGYLAAQNAGRGMGFGGSVKAYGQAFGGGVANMARRDAMRARVAGKSAWLKANRGYGKFRGMASGWFGG